MRRFILVFSLLSLSVAVFCLSAENVVRLEPAAGTASEYSVTELLRVEFIGDSIRFIATDGTVAAEVYKYDYVKLTIADKPTAIEEPMANSQEPMAKKILLNGQVYILFGNKAYRIDGTEVR